MKTLGVLLVVAAVIAAFFVGQWVGASAGERAIRDTVTALEKKWSAFAAEQVKNSLQQIPQVTVQAQTASLVEAERSRFRQQLIELKRLAEQNTDSLMRIVENLATPKQWDSANVDYDNDITSTRWGFRATYEPLANRFVATPVIQSVYIKGLPRDTVVVTTVTHTLPLFESGVGIGWGVPVGLYVRLFGRIRVGQLAFSPQLGYWVKPFAGADLQWVF